MAKIYLSYQHKDLDLITRIGNDLKERGHQILMDQSIMQVGNDWRKELMKELKNSDGLLVLITENSLDSRYVISEIGTTRAYIDENENKKFLIPVIYGDFEVPDFIKDLFCIKLTDGNYESAINKIDDSISNFITRKLTIEEEITKKVEFIKNESAQYVEIAKKTLQRRENQNKWIAYSCYCLGFIALVLGVFFTIDGLSSIGNLKKVKQLDINFFWLTIIILILKSTIIIGLLLACSKYTFILGKSFMHESLRNADRAHAISFGEFFIKAFADKITTYNEVNDIFKNWNIDKSSNFNDLDSNSYDPKFSENLIDVIKTLTDKIQTK
ncbi:hypothetical protein J3D55_003034 [Chryseobacterium ginsenosidimutans]|uniref:toll/interleukin-1 receptor domain-containing protein n=1 Tax=Chryseobacterium ginsenosidimutans TaxID=687846 RepID=UPI00216856C3|nr:toll/interleukin-1 receptor domain-containing protein [Chryseobacterium ginsenosidimutans]MCS3870118.1 hypothetical protein [Chryseobacterium ginsenosidimutans]